MERGGGEHRQQRNGPEGMGGEKGENSGRQKEKGGIEAEEK